MLKTSTNTIRMGRNELSQSSQEQIELMTSTKQEIAQIDKVPKFMAFNQHITYGYRLNHKNPIQIVRSLFMLHNETINIWTHLIGAIVVLSSIVCFFAIVDKAEIQYQLKNYEEDLNQGFRKFNNVLHRIETTVSTFQNSEDRQDNGQNFERFQFQLRTQYDQIHDSIKQSILEIERILKYDVELTNEEKNLRILIVDQLARFQTIENGFENSIDAILSLGFNKQTFSKAHQIQAARKQIQMLTQVINKNVIEYLQLQKATPNPYGVPRWPILVFLFTATCCLGFSAIFHLFYPMSSSTLFINLLAAFKYFRRLDYTGVILNIVGTGIPPIYYSLYCSPLMATIYLTVMIVFGTLLFIILLQNWIHKSKNKKYKPILFGAFGLTYLIPYSHFMLSEIFFDNFGDSFKFSHSNFWWVTSSSSFLFGLYIFIKKWPESTYKHRFDFIGSSHQIWHFLCLCGVAATYMAININYQTRKQCPCP